MTQHATSATDELTEDAISEVRYAARRLANLVNDSPAAVTMCELIGTAADTIEALVSLR